MIDYAFRYLLIRVRIDDYLAGGLRIFTLTTITTGVWFNACIGVRDQRIMNIIHTLSSSYHQYSDLLSSKVRRSLLPFSPRWPAAWRVSRCVIPPAFMYGCFQCYVAFIMGFSGVHIHGKGVP